MSCSAVLVNGSQLNVASKVGSRVYTLTGSAELDQTCIRFEYIDAKTDHEAWRSVRLNSVEDAAELHRKILLI